LSKQTKTPIKTSEHLKLYSVKASKTIMVKTTLPQDTSLASSARTDFIASTFSQSIQTATEFLRNLQHQQIDQQLQQIQEFQKKHKQHQTEGKGGILAQLAAKSTMTSSNSITLLNGDSSADSHKHTKFDQGCFSEDDKNDDKASTLSSRKRSNSQPAKSKSTTKSKLTKSKSTSSIRRKSCNRWTKTENERLKQAIAKLGEKKWNDIAQYVGTKNSDQCNQHWHRVINPKISKKPWTEEEDDILIDRVFDFGESSWKKVAEGLKGRTDIQCRHRYIMLKKYEKQGKGRPIVRKPKAIEQEIPAPDAPLILINSEDESLIHRRQFPNVSLELEENCSMVDTHLSHSEEHLGFISPNNYSTVLTPSDSVIDPNLKLLQSFGGGSGGGDLFKISPMNIKLENCSYPNHMVEWAPTDCYEQILNQRTSTRNGAYSLPELGTFGSDFNGTTPCTLLEKPSFLDDSILF
jgi:hypothetical protein